MSQKHFRITRNMQRDSLKLARAELKRRRRHILRCFRSSPRTGRFNREVRRFIEANI